MGDRAVIHFVDARDEVSPGVYLHWGGSDVPALLRATFDLMATRRGDMQYTAARFVGVVHAGDKPGTNLSLGLWNAPDGGLASIRHSDYSHGDAGVFIVHLDAYGWSIEMHGGYGFPGVGNMVRWQYQDEVTHGRK